MILFSARIWLQSIAQAVAAAESAGFRGDGDQIVSETESAEKAERNRLPGNVGLARETTFVRVLKLGWMKPGLSEDSVQILAKQGDNMRRIVGVAECDVVAPDEESQDGSPALVVGCADYDCATGTKNAV